MMTTLTRRTATAACAVALVLATAACSEDTADPTLPPITQDDATATTQDDAVETTAPPVDDVTETSAPPTLSAEEQDEADVTAALEDYLEVVDAVAMGDAEIEALNPVSVPPARDEQISQAMYYRESGWVQEGATGVEAVELEWLDDDQIQIHACLDLTEAELLDEEGEPVASPDLDRHPRFEYVLDRSESAEHGWAVSDERNLEESCEE